MEYIILGIHKLFCIAYLKFRCIGASCVYLANILVEPSERGERRQVSGSLQTTAKSAESCWNQQGMMGSGRYGQFWVSSWMQNLALPESPFRKVSSAELPWRPQEEEPTAAPSPPNQPTSPETADSWEKGSGCKPPEELALTLAFIFNEPFSWDFTSRGKTLFAASRRVLSRAFKGYGFPQLPLLSWSLHSQWARRSPP